MKRVRIKVCGITRKQDLYHAVTAGADAVGFVVGISSSPRNISTEKAMKLIARVPSSVKSVAVALSTQIGELVKSLKKLNPDAVQLHGEKISEIETFREQLPNTVIIRAVMANPFDAVDNAIKAAKIFDVILIDSFAKEKLGGTGITHDWKLSKLVKEAIHPKPLILAGGLKPENVAEAVRTVEPYAVDVSSGVERQPGIKDQKKIIEFIRNARMLEHENA